MKILISQADVKIIRKVAKYADAALLQIEAGHPKIIFLRSDATGSWCFKLHGHGAATNGRPIIAVDTKDLDRWARALQTTQHHYSLDSIQLKVLSLDDVVEQASKWTPPKNKKNPNVVAPCQGVKHALTSMLPIIQHVCTGCSAPHGKFIPSHVFTEPANSETPIDFVSFTSMDRLRATRCTISAKSDGRYCGYIPYTLVSAIATAIPTQHYIPFWFGENETYFHVYNTCDVWVHATAIAQLNMSPQFTIPPQFWWFSVGTRTLKSAIQTISLMAGDWIDLCVEKIQPHITLSTKDAVITIPWMDMDVTEEFGGHIRVRLNKWHLADAITTIGSRPLIYVVIPQHSSQPVRFSSKNDDVVHTLSQMKPSDDKCYAHKAE